jgi:uncharacterized protein YfaS (alpha-2-macroglobulin family)
MHSGLRRSVVLCSAVVLLSCLGGPPSVPPSGTLGPIGSASGAKTRSGFAVVFAGPRGTVADLEQPAVTVLFNRAAHDPNGAETDGLPAAHVLSEEGQPVAGTWRWVGTHGLLFTPDLALAGSTRFVVTVDAGARSLGGGALAADYRFEFSTARPRIVKTRPSDGAVDVRPDTTFQIEFNEPMDPIVVEHFVHLTARSPSSADGKVIAVHASHPTSGPKRDASIVLTPATPLPLDSAIGLDLAMGLHGQGPLRSSSARSLAFRTYGPIRLADLRCPRSTGPRCQAHRDFTMVLTNAVDPDEFKAHFRALDLPRRKASAADALSHPKKAHEPALEHRIAADPDFGKRYHLTVTAGMRDVFGQTLDRDLTVDVDTEAPFVAAGVPIERDGPAAGSHLDEASDRAPAEPAPLDPNDPRPHRARLDYDLTLGLQGHVVEALAKQGLKSHRVPIGSMNIPSYAMTAAKLQEDEALTWLDRTARPSGDGPPGLGWTWVSPGAPENVRSVRMVDLDALIGGPAARGAALLALAFPGRMGAPTTTVVTVTDLAITAKVSRYGGLVWVTRLSDGAPVPSAAVSLRKANQAELFATTTDAMGLAAIPADRYSPIREGGRIDADTFLVARKDNDWTYQRVERAAASYRSGVDVDLEQRGAWAGLLYTDRGVYRPGETIKLAGVFRRVDAAGIHVAPGEAMRVAIHDAEDETVFDGRAELDAFGEIAVDVPIPKTSHLGEARIVAGIGRKDGESFEQPVLLAAYKASEFKVAVDPDKKEYVRGDVARFEVHAEFLFGAPMGSAPLHNRVSRAMAPFTPPHTEGFVTSDEASVLDHPESNPNAGELRVEDGELDEDGRLSASVDLDLPRMRGAEEVTFETEIEDLTHQTVARRAAVRVHPAAFYLGLERPKSRFLAVGADVQANVVAFDPSGARVPGARTKVELVRRTWTSVVEDEAGAVTRRRSSVVDDVVGACELTPTLKGASCALRVKEPGFFLLRARAKDARGNDVGASTSFYCVDDRADTSTTPVAWADPEARGLKLETDKKQYEAGDVAKVLVRSPFKDADALVTVERAGVLWSKVVSLKGPMPVVEVPVVADYFPNAFIAVHLVRGRVQAPPEVGADVGAPDFRIGVAPIEVDPETHRLNVRITSNRTEYRPGDDVDADVLVRDKDGRTPRAEVTFFAVDEGVLMLTSYQTPDPLPPFAANQRLAVFSVESREALARILPMKNGERIKPLGYEFAADRDDKGGDGGGGGGQDVRADFKTTAYFDAGRVTSAEGRLHYHFKLPDNLTTFRLMAVVAADDHFGVGESAITTSRKLMARPAMPRIVRVGDAFEAGVIVSSRDLGATSADVTLEAKGVRLAGPASRRVQVPKGGSVEVRFPVKAETAGAARFEFSVVGAGETDRVRVDRVVDLPTDVETVSVYGDTTQAAAIALGDMNRVRKDQGGLEVHLASTALVGLKTSFDRAIDYPYGCTEQLTSRILPLLVLPDMARLFGVRMPAKIEDVVDGAVGEIFEHQRGSGGFGFWTGDDDAVPWLSAYAMLAIETAAKKGYFVPKAARDRGIEYLRQALDQSRMAEDDGERPDPDTAAVPGEGDDVAPPDALTPEAKVARGYATLAFVADVLATVSQPDPGYLNRLFDARAHRPLFTQALLLHAMAVAHMPAGELDTLSREIAARVRVDAGAAYVDEVDPLYGDFLDSSSRTTALVLRALVAARPGHPLASLLARGLLAGRTNGAWRSTQENVWALLALDDYRRQEEATPPAFDARVFLGHDRLSETTFRGTSLSDQAIVSGADRVTQYSGQALTFEMTGQGRLFYSAELRYAPTALPDKPADQGLFVQKTLRSLRPEELDVAERTIPKRTQLNAPAGDLVLVDLLLESAEPRDQIVIEDPLPAGLEPIDFALDTSAAGQNVDRTPDPDDGSKTRSGYGAFRDVPGVHRELHDDEALTFLPHVDPGLYHFRYLLRATTPGDFVVPPTRASCMYSPDVWGRTAASRFSVGPSAPKAVRMRSKS